MAAISGPAEAGETEGATALPERRQGVLAVPCGRYPCRDDMLALAQQQADALAAGGAVDVRLDSSREYEDTVEWVFSFAKRRCNARCAVAAWRHLDYAFDASA